MKNKKMVILSIVAGLIIVSAVYISYNTGYLQKLLHIQAYDKGDSPYDDYICFVYKIEPRDGEGVEGIPERLTAYIYTNAPANRTNVQFEWEDDNNKYLSAHIWLDGQNILGGGTVEKISQYEYKVSYPIASGHSYNYKSGYKWCLTVWLTSKPHGYAGASIWYLSELYWTWYKDDRQAPYYKPTANAGGPYIAQVGERIKLDSTKSTTPSGSEIIDWYWDINNDGIWDKYGQTKYITFQDTGVYTIKLLVVNDRAFYDEDTTTITITNINNPPVADVDGPYSGKMGEVITLDGSKSYDPDGNELSYEWDTDGDGKYDATGEKINVRYYTTGNHTVTLKVSDGQYSDTDTTYVVISSSDPENQLPVADAGGPYYGNVSEPITLDGSGSYDPDGYISTWKWDINNDGVWDVSGQYATVSFKVAGNYTVKLMVIDNDGGISYDNATININQPSIGPIDTDSWVKNTVIVLLIIVAIIFIIAIIYIIKKKKII